MIIRDAMRNYFGELEVQERSSAHAGMEVAQEDNFSVTWTQEDSAKNLKNIRAAREMWAARRKLFSAGGLSSGSAR